MAKEQRIFNTVEELAEYVVNNPYAGSDKWQLVVQWDWAYVDPEAGAAWKAEYEADVYPEIYNSPEWKACEARHQEYIARRPKQIKQYSYHLQYRTGSHWSARYSYIYLSTELGEQLDKVWTKTKTSYGENYAHITLPGILKRLGKSDVGAQVKAAKDAAEARRAKGQRNYTRSRARKLAAELLQLMADHPEITFPEGLTALADEGWDEA